MITGVNPRITIVTPSYNQGAYIRETIESILQQGYPNLEYFVVDGGSTDESVEVIKGYAARIDWWVSEKDKGQVDAISKGFARATGDILCWVNSDDVLFPMCLNAVAECYLKYGRPDIITANIAYIDSESRITRLIRIPKQTRFLFFRGVWHGTAPCVFFKNASFKNAGGLNPSFRLSMDLDIWMRMIKAKARIKHIPSYLGGFRWHDSAKTVQSLRSRQTQENTETTAILNTNLIASTPFTRSVWGKVNNIYQVINLNYLRAYYDLKKLGGLRHWRGAMGKLSSHGTPDK